MTLCVLLTAHAGREDALSRYEDAVLGLLLNHEARVISRLRAVDGPLTEVQILEFASEEALASFMADPRRLALAANREAAIAQTTVLRVEPVG